MAILGCTHSAETCSSQQSQAERVVTPRLNQQANCGTVAAVDVTAIPEGWRADVDAAVKRILIGIENPVFAVREGAMNGANEAEIVFVLYENGPDAAHRIGTYKLCRSHVLYELDDLADDEGDVWIRLDRTPF